MSDLCDTVCLFQSEPCPVAISNPTASTFKELAVQFFNIVCSISLCTCTLICLLGDHDDMSVYGSASTSTTDDESTIAT